MCMSFICATQNCGHAPSFFSFELITMSTAQKQFVGINCSYPLRAIRSSLPRVSSWGYYVHSWILSSSLNFNSCALSLSVSSQARHAPYHVDRAHHERHDERGRRHALPYAVGLVRIGLRRHHSSHLLFLLRPSLAPLAQVVPPAATVAASASTSSSILRLLPRTRGSWCCFFLVYGIRVAAHRRLLFLAAPSGRYDVHVRHGIRSELDAPPSFFLLLLLILRRLPSLLAAVPDDVLLQTTSE